MIIPFVFRPTNSDGDAIFAVNAHADLVIDGGDVSEINDVHINNTRLDDGSPLHEDVVDYIVTHVARTVVEIKSPPCAAAYPESE